ncbi:hypothetical protein CK503_09850 [Aliifodinibius salipaludis]|uniref:DUF192 domain-containing protein n=1 Tax=Fodinibius salipaludis TaxID=2032627 RepID=A0A2A2GAU2_9BACT|nr:DUF192 domain-containing protein [Aliifodinibius salipaludis]PAU93959.1 hypothetical protein CK503_09850 [Aliifodinibius salipaludis]
MRIIFTLITVLSLSLIFSSCSEQEKTEDNSQNKGRTLTYGKSVSFLDTKADTLTTIEVAIADSDKERNQGLMDVRDLPSDKGMLFIFDENQPRSFWMANTPLSLDIMFVNADFEIVRIHQNAEPFSEKSFESEEPAKYVIETNGGFSVSHDIQEGTKVSF